MSKKAPPRDEPKGPFNAAFAKLRARLPEPTAPASEPASPPPPREPSPPKAAPARAVVRLERKGRGGKEATVIEKLALAPAELTAWCDALKRTLGCGGAVEDSAITVQGDQRERVRAWLVARGVRKVTLG